MLNSKIFISAAFTLTAFSLNSQAHHAFSAEFDADKPVEIKGVVTKFELVNPHSWIYLDVKEADGKVANWGFEYGAPFSLKERGVTKTSFAVGSEVTITGYRAKSGKNFGYAVSSVTADGRTFQTGGAADAPTAAGQNKPATPTAPAR